jgi:NAD(P)-dependent dehydrogenase (short-subunit alcohol dehydrogenase family)
MLRGACLELAKYGYVVSVVARRHAGLSALAAEARAGGGIINPLPADYRDEPMYAARLRSARAALGSYSLALCWIDSSAPTAVVLTAEMVAHRSGCRFFHVLGSDAADPLREIGPDEDVAAVEGILYRRILLGFVREAEGSRWLTHAEISRGIIKAIDDDLPETTIGTLRPWTSRPGGPGN